MENVNQYKDRFYTLLESTMGDIKPLLSEQIEIQKEINVNELERVVSDAQEKLSKIKREEEENIKKQEIQKLEQELKMTFDKVISPEFNKMSKIQQTELLNMKNKMQSELDKLKGVTVQVTTPSGNQQRSLDQHVTTWVAIASSILALFATVAEKFKRQ